MEIRPKNAPDSDWSKWDRWCVEWSIDLFSDPLASVLDILGWMSFFRSIKNERSCSYIGHFLCVSIHKWILRNLNTYFHALLQLSKTFNNLLAWASKRVSTITRQLCKEILINDPPKPKHGFSCSFATG